MVLKAGRGTHVSVTQKLVGGGRKGGDGMEDDSLFCNAAPEGE